MEENNSGPVFNVNYKVLNDEDRMPWGAHKGVKMSDVPATYLKWLCENNKCDKSVRDYISRNEDRILKGIGGPTHRDKLALMGRACGITDAYIAAGDTPVILDYDTNMSALWPLAKKIATALMTCKITGCYRVEQAIRDAARDMDEVKLFESVYRAIKFLYPDL